MKNRFTKIYFIAFLFFCISFPLVSYSQCGSDITFTDTRGTDTVIVGNDCKVVLNISHVPTLSGYSYPAGGTGGINEKGKYSLIGFDNGPKDTLIVKPSGTPCFIAEFKIVSILDVTTGNMIQSGDTIPSGHTIKISYLAKNTGGTMKEYGLFRVIVDKSAPVFTVIPPADLTATCSLPTPSTVEATDNCSSGSNLKISMSDSGNWSVCSGGTVIRTWTATDSAGNTATIAQTITMLADTSAPVITGFPVSLSVSCDAADYSAWLATQRAAFQATDNCSGLKLTDNAPATFSNTCGSVEVTFTATDTCGKTASVKVTFTTFDNIKPNITTPAKDTIRICDGGDPLKDLDNWLNAHGGAVATDNCGTVSWSYFPLNPSIGGCSGNQGSIVSFVAKDICGNTDTTRASFTITDINPPNITVGAQNKLVECNGSGNTTDFSNWIATRAGSMASDVCTPLGAIKLTLQVNGSTVDEAGARAALDASIAGGCKDNIVIGGTSYNNIVGQVKVMFAYTDLCGNVSTTDAIFAIRDTVNPSFIVNASDLKIECDTVPTVSQAFQNWYNSRGGATAVDGCSNVSYRSVPDFATASANLTASQATNCGNTGSVTVSFYAIDGCGNETPTPTIATFSIVDNISPKINPTSSDLVVDCENTATVNNDKLQNWLNNNGGSSASDPCGSITWIGYNWTDNLGNSGTKANPPVAPTNNCSYQVSVTFIVADECGNQSTTKSKFQLKDNITPTLVGLPIDITVECNAVPTKANVSATDNCATTVNVFYQEVNTGGNCIDNYKLTRTWTATDDCGNSTTGTQVITVVDTQNPTLSGIPSDITVECNAIPDPALPTANDNCDTNVSIEYSQSSTQNGDVNQCGHYNYTLTRTWKATDNCGNSVQQSQTITVKDTKAPTFTLPSNVTIECTASNDPGDTGVPTNSSDNCAPFTINHSDSKQNGSCENNYTILRTWVATDVCGNTYSATQNIVVVDTKKPVITTQSSDKTIDCTTDGAAESAFAIWVSQFGGAVFSDNCGIGTVFAAVPGTYNPATIDLNNPSTFPQNAGGLNAASCPSPISGIYRFEKVDFVIVDKCNNVSVTSATFYVQDNTPPLFNSCPKNLTVSNDPGQCSADVLLLPPSISDGCANGSSFYADSIIRLVPSFPNSEEIPVGTINYMFNVPPPPISATTAATFRIDLNNMDAEEGTEYYNIFSEDGTLLGQTVNTPTQCGHSETLMTLSATDINTWAADGLIKFQLVPNIPSNLPGRYAINPICPNGNVKAVLKFGTTSVTGISYQYSVDGGAKVTVSPIASTTANMSVGTHTITYYATDCAGNSATCSSIVVVNDTEKPNLICPSNLSLFAPLDSCSRNLQLSIPTIIDNCGLSTYTQIQPTNQSDALLTYTYNPNLLEYLADNKIFNFGGLTANAYGSNVTLSLNLIGDVESSGEYFTILAEDNSIVGTTEVGQANVIAGNCNSPSIINFSIPTSSFNLWAKDGIVTFRAISNISFAVPPSIPGRGINPCNNSVTANGQNDGTSKLTATLSYNPIFIDYYTTGATVTATKSFPTPSFDAFVNFKSGVTNVFYIVPDGVGNKDTCSYSVTISDNIPPVAKCSNNTFVFVNASGENDTIKGSQIDAGSYDNCGIISYSVTPNLFNCNQAGTITTVTMTVTDGAGLTSQCTSTIKIDIASPKPTYVRFCGSDTVKLFANPPGFGTSFKYKWTGPGNFASTDQNPAFKAGLSGTYTVEIEGFTGCKSTGSVQVIIDSQNNVPTITALNTPICNNKPLVLSTQTYFGNNVIYKWYKGTPNSGLLLDSTNTPTYSLSNPISGNYYVIVEIDNCVSNPSIPVSVVVNTAPIAVTYNDTIKICEGEVFTLGTNNLGTGYTYSWTGPDGFTSSSSNPPSKVATLQNAGTYILLVTSPNGCVSNPVTTIVVVTPRPPKPILTSNGTVCAGDSIVLYTNITNADTYHWIRPDFTEIVTITPKLTIYNAKPSDGGTWTMYVVKNGCKSEVSNSDISSVVPKPDATFSVNPNPGCTNSLIQLTANNFQNVTYVWSGPSGQIAPIYNPQVNPVQGTYSLTIITSSGCSNFSSQFINIKQAPEIISISDNAMSCTTGAQDIKLTPIVTGSSAGYIFEWRNPQGGFISLDSILTIPNATFNDKGSYTLYVTDKAFGGCKSNAKTHVLDISQKPFTPTLALVGTTVCEGDNLQLDVKTSYPLGANIKYKFITPQGVQIRNVPTYLVTGANTSNNGNYYVVVDIDGCLSDTSNLVVVKTTAIPAKPIATSNSPVCNGDSLKLCTTQIPTATYEWTGPNFNSTLTCPSIYPVSTDKSGIYKLRVIVNGCASPYSDDLNVQVLPSPPSPSAVANPPSQCINANSTLTLSVIPPGIPGAKYIWYNASTDTVIGGPTSALNMTISNLLAYGNGIKDFYVRALVGGCQSLPTIVSTTFYTIPSDKSFAGNDVYVCEDQLSAKLSAIQPSIGTGTWSLVNGSGLTITNINDPNTTVNGITPGSIYTLRWSLSNGDCKDYSSDDVKIISNFNVLAKADSLNICNVTTTSLSAKPAPAGIIGTWSQAPGQAGNGVNIVNPNDPKSQVTGLLPGNTYYFTWTLSIPGCKDSYVTVAVVNAELPNEIAFAGADFTKCANGVIDLKATQPVIGKGLWTSLDPTIQIVNPSSATTTALALRDGEYQFVWSISNNACGVYSTDTLKVKYNYIGQANDDGVYNIKFDSQSVLKVTLNDILPTNWKIRIKENATHGALTYNGNGEFTYLPGLYVGLDRFIYEVCRDECPNECTSAIVTLAVGDASDCEIPTVITPNNDGVNDEFFVPCLESGKYPNNTVIIFNQWGDEVFRASPYNSTNRWKGTYDGQDLPASTYFFVVTYGNGEAPKSGFIMLER